ncbi:MAG: hypothetical protein JWM85_3601, partial [Acidimicrobiaceae bacterium]|nr:hypothetical protein [Acidimicrobiaceae bacterium]
MSATIDALKHRILVLSTPTSVPLSKDRDTESGVPIDTAVMEVPDVLPGGIVGPRGRDNTGRVRIRRSGLPAIHQPGAGQQEFTTRKEHAYPFPVPPQLHRTGFTALLTNAGPQFDSGSFAFSAHGLAFDNYSTVWLYLPGLSIYIPPNCVRLAQPLPAGVQKIAVVAEAPPGVVQPALTANGGF